MSAMRPAFTRMDTFGFTPAPVPSHSRALRISKSAGAERGFASAAAAVIAPPSISAIASANILLKGGHERGRP